MTPNDLSKAPNLLIYGETLIDEFPQQKILGGAPFNVASSLSLLGARPLMLGRVGRDRNGDAILEACARAGLSVEGMQIDGQHPTGRVLVELTPAVDVSDGVAHRFAILNDQAYDYIDVDPIATLLGKYFQETPPDLIYFGSLIQRNAVSQSTLIALLEAEFTEGATKFLDLNLRDGQFSLDTVISSLNYCDILKLNEDELQFVIQHACPETVDLELTINEQSLRRACEVVMAEYYMQAIIITLGAHGYFYLDANGECLYSLTEAPIEISIVDTVGAGDAFAAAFIFGWQANWALEKSLSAAHNFASAICAVRGAVSSSVGFCQEWLGEFEKAFDKSSHA
jgi:fructokinase